MECTQNTHNSTNTHKRWQVRRKSTVFFFVSVPLYFLPQPSQKRAGCLSASIIHVIDRSSSLLLSVSAWLLVLFIIHALLMNDWSTRCPVRRWNSSHLVCNKYHSQESAWGSVPNLTPQQDTEYLQYVLKAHHFYFLALLFTFRILESAQLRRRSVSVPRNFSA